MAQSSFANQIRAIFSVSYVCISYGNFIGYTSSAILSMQEDKSSFPSLSEHDVSWIGSLGPLGALTGALCTTFLLKKWGARRTIGIFGYTSLLCSWIILGFLSTGNLSMVFIGRFIGGVGSGIVIACAPLYTIDIASTRIRGKLGVMPQFLMICGILMVYILGSFLAWDHLAIVCTAIVAPAAILIYSSPDNPTWLMSTGQSEKATDVLISLHGQSHYKSVLAVIDQSLNRCSTIVPRQKKNSLLSLDVNEDDIEVSSQKKNKFLNPVVIKSSLVALSITSFQQLTGINGVTFYAGTIFQHTSGTSSWNPHIPPILLASIQVFASLTSGLIVERVGRKTLLLLSSFFLSLTSGFLGLYFYHGISIPSLSWVPLVTLILFFFAFAIGFGPVTYVIVAEILVQEVRHVMNPLAIANSWLCMFIVTKTFPILLPVIHIYGIFWLYSCIAVISTIFVLCFVPETKGRRLFEIRGLLHKSLTVDITTVDILTRH